jgi:diguanylate cyclase (GGDEF)-like protein
MAWHTVVIAVLALALACDLYLRGRALLKDRGRTHAGLVTWHENRRAFYELAGREFERARRYDHPFTLGYFDLDDYKEVADRFSLLTAEGMLRLVAESARRSIRASDVVARLGGDSFAVLLPEAGPEAADTVIRKLQQSVRHASHETALPLSISGGVVTCLQPAESLEAVIGAADRLLSGAKGAGNDSFWCEVIAPQPLEAFEPARLRRPFRLPPGFDLPMPPPLRRS